MHKWKRTWSQELNLHGSIEGLVLYWNHALRGQLDSSSEASRSDTTDISGTRPHGNGVHRIDVRRGGSARFGPGSFIFFCCLLLTFKLLEVCDR